jgi:hypothetical protein
VNEQLPKQKEPGPDTLLGRIRKSVLKASDTQGVKPRDGSQAAPAVKGWSESLVTISTGVVAIATLATWFFGGSKGFPAWVTYVLTVFVAVAVYKYSERYLRGLLRLFLIRQYLRQQRFRLVDSIEGFSDLMSLRLESSLTSVLKKISGGAGVDVVDPDLLPIPDQFLSNILVGLSEAGSRITIREFQGVLNDLSTLIKFSTYFFFTKPTADGVLRQVKAEDRNGLEAVRENYADFLRRFEVFYDEVRLHVGTGARARFEIPPPIK